MSERRKYKRFKNKMLISTLYQDDKDAIEIHDSVLTEDIGAGGVKISIPKKFPKGKVLNLKIFLFSDPIPLNVEGKIVWMESKKRLDIDKKTKSNKEEDGLLWAGVQFINVDPFVQERVIRWIKEEFDVNEV